MTGRCLSDQADARAALAAAAQSKPAPVIISLKAKAPVANPPSPSPAPFVEPPRALTKAQKKAAAKSASTPATPATAATPDVAASAPVKKGWAIPASSVRTASPAPSTVDGPTPGEALLLSRPSTPAAAPRGRPAVKAVDSASRATSVASTATSAAPVRTKPRSPSPTPFSAVEQAPVFSRKAKKEKNRAATPKKKAGKVVSTAVAASPSPDADDVEVHATPEEIATKARELANRTPPLDLGELYNPLPPTTPASLSQLLHQLAPVLVSSSLSFIAPLSHTRDLIETLSVASCLEPQPLAVALSALTSPTSEVTMEDAVAAFHQLLTLLTDTITNILNILPRDPPRDQDVAKRFGAMFMDVRRGAGLAGNFAKTIATSTSPKGARPTAGVETVDGGEKDVERLKSALYQRANYLAEQLTRLEDLHEEINSVRSIAVYFFGFILTLWLLLSPDGRRRTRQEAGRRRFGRPEAHSSGRGR